MQSNLRFGPSLLLLPLVAACAGQPNRPVAGVPPPPPPAAAAAPAEGVKLGRPYTVFGRTYVPVDDRSYEETGIASWYGPTFHARQTANGETYDQDDVTAAHRTLPMPSWVEVRNLDNGRKLTVRINDRGPFVEGRIIDLSRRSAQLLGVDRVGLARVHVRRVFPDGDWALNTPPLRQPGVAVASARTTDGPPPPAPPPGQPVREGRFIQVAALSDEARAKALATELAAAHGPAYANPAANGLWRVRIGPLSPERAAAVLSGVQAAGFTDARLIP